MRALVYDFSLPRYALALALGRTVPGLYYGRGTNFDLRPDWPAPVPPSDDFATLAPTLAGICGTDLAAIFQKSSPALSAFASLPAVFGHEVLARVVAPPARSALREGDRVVVDPFLSCTVRGITSCARCRQGDYASCERAGTGPRKGMMIGACAELPGAFGDRMVAHEFQLFRVPDGLDDDRAVLTEPLSVGVHAVLRNPPRAGERVLVIGGGIIALGTAWALRELHPDVSVTLLALEDYQTEMALALGVHHALRPRGEDVVLTLARETQATVLRPMLGRPFLAGGYDQVIDCIGSQRSLDDALRVTRAGGTVVLLGGAGEITKLDWSFVWSKELTIVGSLAYGWVDAPHAAPPTRARTFAVTLELLTSTARPVGSLVTHRYPLEQFGAALEANLARRATRSIKTVFTL